MQVDCQGPARTIHLILLEDVGDADYLRYNSCRESSTLRAAHLVVRLPEASADTQPAPASGRV